MILKPDKKTIEIIKHPDSLERICQNGRVVYLLGIGKMKSPGHPSGNQQHASQLPFFNYAMTHPHLFSIYHRKDDLTTFLGMYYMIETKKKITSAGFTYFEYKMVRHFTRPLPQIQRID